MDYVVCAPSTCLRDLMLVTPVFDHGINFSATDLVRSPGLHASDIYSDLFKRLEPKRYDFGDAPPDAVLMALGTAWERHLEYLMEKSGLSWERPGEFMSPEGIAFSPDGIKFNGVTKLGELKLTSMSAKDMPTEPCNGLPPKLDKYDCQMKLYAHWLGITEGWLAILFLHQPWKPDFRVFDIQWTKRELQENHAMCMNHARHAGLLK